MSDLITDLYRQNEWANLTAIEACRPLSDDQLDATAVGTFGSIRETLTHIVGSEGTYASRLGAEPARRLRRDDPWPGLDALADMASSAAAALVTAGQEASNRVIRVGSETEPYDVEAAVILIQAFHHSTEHRSQICTILTTLGFEPPELSGWEWGLAVRRMHRA